MSKIEKFAGDLNPWQPAHQLNTYSLQEIRFSSGYLLGSYNKRFKSVLAHWLPVFDLSKVTLNHVESIPGFQFPGELDFLYVFKKGEEFGLLGVDEDSFRSIATLFLESDLISDLSGEFVVEYLARKLLSSFTKSWNDIKESDVSFYGLTDVGEIDIEGHLELRFELGEKNVSIHIGLGPDLLQQLDLYLKEDSLGSKSQRGKKNLIRLGIQVDPKVESILMSGEAVIVDQQLEDPFCAVLADGRRILGHLGQFNQRFAFKSLGVLSKDQSTSSFVELAQADVENIESLFNQDVIFLSKTTVSKNATLVRDYSSLIADLSIYTSGNRFVLKKS